jgi:hypothetical protein
MSKFSSLIQSIKKKLFGQERRKLPIQPASALQTEKDYSPTPSMPASAVAKKRQPYFIQIGFDFGTSYSKCICRDVMTNKAWVCIPEKSEQQELPFLIPSSVVLVSGKLKHIENHRIQYPKDGMYHLKHALVKVAMHEWNDPVLAPYRRDDHQSDVNLAGFVETCAVYFLAGALGAVRQQVRRRLPDYGSFPEDYMAVNLSVPVSDAESPEVNALYHRIVCEAWGLSKELADYPPIYFTELESLRKEKQENSVQSLGEACFIYPEVSANVQGFVRSRVSSPGIYLFSDTGAGTVDQSIFIFSRQEQGGEHLTYLHGSVLPLGSSHIERHACIACGIMDWQTLEMWRERKERGGMEPELRAARDKIAAGLIQGTEATLAFAKRKLYVPDELNGIRVIFGGGGHCEYPYRSAVMRPFSGQLFRQEISPDVVGLPVPRDLELKDSEARWMRRLSVAYGLSYEKSELASFTYPKNVSTPTPEQIWRPRKHIPDALSKDEC